MVRVGRVVLSAFALAALAVSCTPPPAPKPAAPAIPKAGVPIAPLVIAKCAPFVETADPKDVKDAPADPDASTGRKAKPDKASDTCATADSNLTAAKAKILADSGGAVVAQAVWDHKTPPKRFDRIAQRFALTKADRDAIGKNGFAVLARDTRTTYAWAFHEIYQSELPVYVSADAILHAVYASNDRLIADLETNGLMPLLARTLSAMHCALGGAADAYPPEVARDLDVYLTVARSLLENRDVASVLGTAAEATALVRAAQKASGLATIEIFGRARLIDWSSYQPRGHYAQEDSPLGAYFRSAMWLSRLEYNLVSRSSRSSQPPPSPDPRETPREAIDALALADLVQRSGVLGDVQTLDHAWGALAGRREDVSVHDLLALRQKAKIDRLELSAFDRLKAAIGNDFQRTARLHPMPEGSKVLPAIATFLGPRVVADTAALRPLLHSEVPDRHLVSAGDVAYVLGLDRGKHHLAADIAKHPELATQLDVARKALTSAPDAGDLYGAWLGALRGAATLPDGVLPSFMSKPAYEDLRMNTLIAGFGQIRHNYVLMAGQSYDEDGCVIPDGWVEPLPAVYDGIASYAARGASALAAIDPKGKAGAVPYFNELEKIARVLSVIARHELAGRALTDAEKQFLSMIVEMLPGSTGNAPTYTGWYFDLFRGRSEEALIPADFIADYQTSGHLGQVVYAGATEPRMGIFVVDAGGPPRMMVGPVARAYEVTGPVDKRYDDAGASKVADKRDPWAASYTVAAPKVPAIAAQVTFPDEEPKAWRSRQLRVIVRARTALPAVTVDLLDHHRVTVASVTRAFPAGKPVTLVMTPRAQAEGIRLRVGDFSSASFRSGPEGYASVRSGGVDVDPSMDEPAGN